LANFGKPRLDAALLVGADDRAVPGRGSGGGRRAGWPVGLVAPDHLRRQLDHSTGHDCGNIIVYA